MTIPYATVEPSRSAIDALEGPAIIEFGTHWCGFCQAAQPLIESALAHYPHLRHIKIEDGKGRALGRTFQVKLWPTLIVLRDGQEIARVVRPKDANAIREGIGRLSGSGA